MCRQHNTKLDCDASLNSKSLARHAHGTQDGGFLFSFWFSQSMVVRSISRVVLDDCMDGLV